LQGDAEIHSSDGFVRNIAHFRDEPNARSESLDQTAIVLTGASDFTGFVVTLGSGRMISMLPLK
jgi:hypothetical protein